METKRWKLIIEAYACNFTEGYKTNGTIAGNISGDTLVAAQSTDSVSLKLSDDGNEFSYIVKQTKKTYKKEHNLPGACSTNGNKITSLSPKTAADGEPTTFIISFTYQVESTSNAVIKAGFTRKEDNLFELSDNDLNVTKKGWRPK